MCAKQAQQSEQTFTYSVCTVNDYSLNVYINVWISIFVFMYLSVDCLVANGRAQTLCR